MSGVNSSLNQLGMPNISTDLAYTADPGYPTGTVVQGFDPYWGPREYMLCYAAGTIDQYGIVTFDPTLTGGRFRIEATAVANTANLGRSLGIAMASATVGQYVWVALRGLVPVQCTASVAASTAFGIVASGKGGALAAGKQVLNARNVLPATTAVVKANCVANSGSTVLKVSNSEGWFVGAYLSGTGVAAGARILDIQDGGKTVIMSGAATAVISGSVTATYNNGAVFFNVAFMQYPFAQGAIT